MTALVSAVAILGKCMISPPVPALQLTNRCNRFLCTSSVSDILYSTIEHFAGQGALNITAVNLPFFNHLHPTGRAELGVLVRDDLEFHRYLRAMFTYADSFLNVIRWHATRDGRLSEQFDGTTGFQRGAHDLTWSYGSFLEAAEKRDRAWERLQEEVENKTK